MKKILALILVLSMVFGMAACAKAEAPAPTPELPAQSEPAPAPEVDSTVDGGNSQDTTVGQALLQNFRAQVEADSSLSAQTIADNLLTDPVIQFFGATMPVEPGLLSGFGNAEISGFSEGVMFAPMIGSIAFIGYVFILEDAATADEFVSTLSENADPRWNICVEAEETVVDNVGGTVFFVMCPASM